MKNAVEVQLAPYIQNTLIAVGITRDEIVAHCEQTLQHGFDAAMVPAGWVGVAREALRGTGVKVASAVDFPHGTMTTRGRIAEMQSLVADGADEVDLAVHTDWLLSGMTAEYAADLRDVIAAAGSVPVKVMLELPLLTPALKELAVSLSLEAGAAVLKNASAGAVGIATAEDIAYLKARVPEGVRVKASGGIKTREHALALIAAGADLIGTSNGVALTGGEGVDALGDSY